MVEPLFVDANLKVSDQVILTGEEAKHASTVRRMRVGEAIQLTNGQGLRVRGVVSAIDKQSVTVDVSSSVQEDKPAVEFFLVQALAKGDRDELAIQAATELGVSGVIPWGANRSVTKWEGKKLESGQNRWQSIVTEAAKQSLRAFIPEVEPCLSSNQLKARLAGFEMVIVLDPIAAKTLQELHLPKEGQVAIVVGPEGGISPEELELLSQYEGICLGQNILRTSTAGPAVLAALTLKG